MKPTEATDNRFDRRRVRALVLALLLASMGTVIAATEPPSPGLSKVFMPDTIGPDSTAMLIFTLDNSESAYPLSGLAFTDTLPGGVTLAAPALISSSCALDVGGSLSAPDGGTTIALTGGKLGAGKTCKIVVNVTAGAVDASDTTYMNTSSTLTSNEAPAGGPATDDLMVDVDRPGFSKAFSTAPPTDPATVALGGRSTLTFTIDNSLNDTLATSMTFSDTLPPGMVVASPANVTNTCKTGFFTGGLVGATPGSGVISLASGGGLNVAAVDAFDTCEITVDVIGGAVGSLGNTSGELSVVVSAVALSAGKAAAVLEVTGFETSLALEKEFIDDPVAPGGTVTLEFTITNQDRDDAATGLTFSDDLEATLGGLTPTLPLPADPCGAGSLLSLSMAGVLTLTGGTLPAEGSCTFSVELTVDPASSPGAYPNTTTAIMGDVGGSPVTGNSAGDILFVVDFPVLTKEFTVDPVAAGGTTTLEFTITNPSTSAMSGITFVDELTDNSGGLGGGMGNGFLPFPVSVGLPPMPDPPCGGSSSLALVSLGTDRQGLELTGGSLAADDGMAGGMDECTFSLTVDIPVDLPGGTYLNTTEEISAVLDDEPGTPTVVGPQASGTLVVAGAPALTKEFTDDPVLPSGGSVTLEFNLSYDVDEGTPDATDISFTDDLTTVFAGLVAASVDTNTCSGAVVDISTDTFIDVSGGTLSAGESCTIILTLTVPPGAPVGFHSNATSDVTADVDGVMAANDGGEDDLLVTPLAFTKEFTDDPVIAGDTVTLEFTIDNTLGSTDATGVTFSDVLSAAVPGMTWTGSSEPMPCGGTPLFIGTGTFTLLGGAVTAGTSCVFTIDVLVPPGTADDGYLNVTGSLSSSLGTVPPATDELLVQSTLLELTKEFTDDPVLPEGLVTLKFTLTNLSSTDDITDIAFSDDLDAALAGLVTTDMAISNTCGGMATLPASLFDYSGGSLTAGMSCMIELSLEVPPGPLPGSTFPNTTSGVTGKVGALDVSGSAASDDLEIRLLTFSKVFDGPTFADDIAVLTFTITNFDSVNAATGLAFSDDLDAVISGLVAVLPTDPDPPCGAGSVAAGTGFFTVTGASLAPAGSPGDSCTFDVVVAVPDTATPGSFLNTTSELSQSGLPVADPATAFLDILPTEADLSVTKDDLFEPATAGRHQVYEVTVANAGPATAESVVLTDVLPAGFLPVLIEPLGLCGAAGGVVTCPLGDLPAGASVTVTIRAYIEPIEAAVMVANMASVTSDTTDPAPADNDVMEENDVLPLSGVAALPDITMNGEPEIVVPLLGSIDVLGKDASGAFLHLTEVFPDGWALAGFDDDGAGSVVVLAVETATGVAVAQVVAGVDGTLGAFAVLPPDFAPLAMSVVPDDGSGRTLILVAARRLADGLNRVFGFDAADGSQAAAVPFASSLWPIDVAGIDGFGGSDALSEVGLVAVRMTNGKNLLKVKELDAAVVGTQTVSATLIPTALEGLPNCCALPAPELAVLGYDPTTDKVRVQTLDADGGGVVSDENFNTGGRPFALARVPDFGDSPADELAALYRNAAGRTGGRVRDADTGAQLSVNGYGPLTGNFPLGLTVAPDSYGGPADELAVYWIDPFSGVSKVTLRDAAGGPVVVAVPIP